MKNVLIVSYSQSGQLADIATALARSLETGGTRVYHEVLQPEPAFPFPWPFFTFFDAFPESVCLDPRPNKPLAVPDGVVFNLVVLAWTVWYLSPSQPMTAFLQSAEGKRLIKGKPVVSLVACRNMWFSAFDALKTLITEAEGLLVDHVALTDESPAMLTFITTPRWMLTGRRDHFLGMPPAGITAQQTAGVARFGTALAGALARDEEKSGQPMLSGLRAVKVEPYLVLSERTARRVFGVWSKFVRLFGRARQRRRVPALILFAIYLIIVIITIVPLHFVLQRLIAPLFARRTAAAIRHYEQPSGADDARMTHE